MVLLSGEEDACLKLWVKLGCSPRYTQIVPKWHLDGQLARTDFSNTQARRNAQKSIRFSRERILCGFGLLRNGEKRMFPILGQSWGLASLMAPGDTPGCVTVYLGQAYGAVCRGVRGRGSSGRRGA